MQGNFTFSCSLGDIINLILFIILISNKRKENKVNLDIKEELIENDLENTKKKNRRGKGNKKKHKDKKSDP